MNTTFVTSGEWFEVQPNDMPTYFLIGRKGYKEPIKVSKMIDSYQYPNISIHIDAYGNPWVKAPHIETMAPQESFDFSGLAICGSAA